MTTKYVEDYRMDGSTTLSDTATIQRAIDHLNDGDTLVFNKQPEANLDRKNGIYIIDRPIHFTSCNSFFDEEGNYKTGAGRDLSRVTIDGGGCSIMNANSFNNNSEYKNFFCLFCLSDGGGKGMFDSVISNFVFEYNDAYDIDYTDDEEKPRCTAIGVTAGVTDSPYMEGCTIRDCEFLVFDVGIRFGGDSDTVRDCYFSCCEIGINADCPNYGKIFSNRFEKCDTGLFMTKPIWSEVYSNFFHKTTGDSIAVNGTLEREVEKKNEMTNMHSSIYSNVILGNLEMYSSVSGINNQRGIYINGVKDLIIRDNSIYNMDYIEGETDGVTHDKLYGIGIFVGGQAIYGIVDDDGNVYDNVRYSERVIVSGNIIRNCKSCAIKTNYSHDCLFIGNSLYRDTVRNVYPNTEADPVDYAIYVDRQTSNHKIASNALYCYDNGNGVYKFAGSSSRVSDSSNFSEKIKTVDGTISSTNAFTICLPEDMIQDDGEYFVVSIPENYSAPTVSFVQYKSKAGLCYSKSDNDTVNLSQYSGTSVKLQYIITKSQHTEEIGIKFICIDC